MTRDIKTPRRALLAGLGAAGVLACRPWGAGAAEVELPGSPLTPHPMASGFHAGMGLAHIHRDGRGYGSERSRAQLRALKALGVTHVALTPFGYQRLVTDPEPSFGDAVDRSLTDDHVRAEAANARAEGLAVCLKPHIWSWEFMRGRSRQDIAPAEGWPRWFEGYGAFAERYAALAEEIGAEVYVVGLEYLKATEDNPGAWADVARRCRARYGGALTYAANWWREVELFTDWSAFDMIGVNAYFPLEAGAAPSAQALREAWRPHVRLLKRLSEAQGKDVLVTELGVRAVAGAHAKPWDTELAGAADGDAQSRYYEAALAELQSQPWVRGVYWWKWFTDPQGERDLYVPSEASQEVLRRWWLGG